MVWNAYVEESSDLHRKFYHSFNRHLELNHRVTRDTPGILIQNMYQNYRATALQGLRHYDHLQHDKQQRTGKPEPTPYKYFGERLA